MGTNFEIYLIGLAVLFFLIVVFLFIKKITSNGNLKVKIENIILQITSYSSTSTKKMIINIMNN